jgi:hypothetical protein
MNVLTFEVHTLPTSTSKASFAASHPMQRIICDATETGILQPNVCEGDRIQEESDSDGKVPQSFLIEYTASYHTPLSYKGRARDIHHPTNVTMHVDAPRISVPPCPSEINVDHPPLARSPPTGA